jgi:ferric-chelate reductase
MDATAELLSEDVVRLRLCRPPHFHWSPGQSAYLTMPSVSTVPFEAHPFAIASVYSSLFQTTTPEYSPESGVNKDIQISASSAPLWKELVFLVKVHKGFTKKLKAVAVRGGKIKVFVDGPYGPSPDLSSYDTCILVAGEPHGAPHYYYVLMQARRVRSFAHPPSLPKRHRVCPPIR